MKLYCGSLWACWSWRFEGERLERNKCPKDVDGAHVGRHHGRFARMFASRHEAEIVHLDAVRRGWIGTWRGAVTSTSCPSL